MEIHCYSCGLEIGEPAAEVETAAHALSSSSQFVVRMLLTRTVFSEIPPASFCTFCLGMITAFTDVFDRTVAVPHVRFDVRTTIGGHSSTVEWASCADCGLTLREPCSHPSSLLPPAVRLRRRMMLHAAASRYGRGGHTEVFTAMLDHRDGA